MIFEKTGEQFVPTDSNPEEVLINLERYYKAAQLCQDKFVLDAGCGCGLGTYLYSLVAKNVIAVDHNPQALVYASQFPFDTGKVKFIKRDFDNDRLPKADICVALEVIEHLSDPRFFLRNLDCDELYFSIPLNSLAISKYHLYDFKTVDDVKALVGKYYEVENYETQAGRWICGLGKKIKEEV